MRALLEHGANVNTAADSGDTALMRAIKRNFKVKKGRRTACLELLLAHKADVNATNNHGYTALMDAARCYRDLTHLDGSLDILRTLLEHGADINAADNSGDTALMRACRRYQITTGSENPGVVDLLLRNGAQVDATDEEGQTALWYAGNALSSDSSRGYYHALSKHRRIECFRLLLKHGANPDLQTKRGETPRLFFPELQTLMARLEKEAQASAPKAAPMDADVRAKIDALTPQQAEDFLTFYLQREDFVSEETRKRYSRLVGQPGFGSMPPKTKLKRIVEATGVKPCICSGCVRAATKACTDHSYRFTMCCCGATARPDSSSSEENRPATETPDARDDVDIAEIVDDVPGPDDCPICFERIVDGGVRPYGCTHPVCGDCLPETFATFRNCPICRRFKSKTEAFKLKQGAKAFVPGAMAHR